MSDRDQSQAEAALAVSAVLHEVSLYLVLHPEFGEMIVIKDDDQVTSADKIKMFELAKLYTAHEMLSNMGEFNEE